MVCGRVPSETTIVSCIRWLSHANRSTVLHARAVPQRYTMRGGGLQQGEAREYLVQFDVGAQENAGRTLWIGNVHLEETLE